MNLNPIMKKRILHLAAITITICLLTSCKNSNENTTDESSPLKSITEKTGNDPKAKVYSFDKNCVEFFKGIDFSSLCFTDSKTPEYKDNDMDMDGRRCQYHLADDQLTFAVTYGSMYKDIPKENLVEAYQGAIEGHKLKSKLMFKEIKEIEGLGDYAAIGTNAMDGTFKNLDIFLSNVSISIAVEAGFCGTSDEELIKMGTLLLDYVKNSN